MMPEQANEMDKEVYEAEMERREDEALKDDYGVMQDSKEGLPKDLEFMFDITKFPKVVENIGLSKEISTSNFKSDIDEKLERVKYLKVLYIIEEFPEEQTWKEMAWGEFGNYLLEKMGVDGWARVLSRSTQAQITRRVVKEEPTSKKPGGL
jgi:hypothetical protein